VATSGKAAGNANDVRLRHAAVEKASTEAWIVAEEIGLGLTGEIGA
jgi:hypothetical protein